MQIVTLNLTPGSVAPVVYASQNDDGRVIRFKLVDGDINNSYSLNGLETITAKLTKPDGTETTIAITNPGSGKNYIDLVNGASDYDQEGVYLGEIVLTRNATVLGTGNFILEVEADAYGSDVEARSASGIIASFETALSEPLVALKANFLCSGGNGTPSTPIPIVGHSELNLTRCGVNLFDEELEVGVISSDGSIDSSQTTRRTTSYIPVKSGTNVYLACPNSALNGRYAYYDSDKNLIEFNGNGFANNNITIPSGAAYLRITVGSGYGTIYNNDISLNYPATDTEYHAYNGQTITLDLNGTRYGGYVDVVNGKLVVTWVGVDMGSLTWQVIEYQGISYKVSNSIASTVKAPTLSSETANIKCPIFTNVSRDELDNYNYVICIDPNKNIDIIDNDYSTASDFTTAMSGIILAYELDTPIEVDITPAFLSAIQGQNNVFHDGNGDVELEYLDLKV